MSEMMRIQFKMVFRSTPLLVLLILFQLLLGQISASVFEGEEPELKIALKQNAHGALSDSYAQVLENSPDIETITFPSDSEVREMLETDSVQAIVVLSEDFDARIQNGDDDAIQIYPAPGIADISFIEEILSVETVRLRADVLLIQALEDAGMEPEDYVTSSESTSPLIQVAYTGPEEGSIPFTAPPVFGIPALLLLFAFLHAATLLPGPDNRRFFLSKKSARQKHFVCAMLTLTSAWIFIAVVYAAIMRLIYHTQIPFQTQIVLILLPIYAITIAALFVLLGKRTWTPWGFVFWLALNMTLGGGLWNTDLKMPWLRPLVPVHEVISVESDLPFSSIAMLLIEIAVGLILCQIVLLKKDRRNSSQGLAFVG
ncbi:MAG: ABC transporter permease [Clostridiales Family XIII bacterium]|jgi:hypothetical protein|nr:ABC transporter permease [Clostridiales Family XIII bacterium]